MADMQDARAYANEIFTHASNEHADAADLGLYLARVVAELFELSPSMREHVSDFVLAEVVEELHRLGQPGRDASRLVAEVQRHWTNERG